MVNMARTTEKIILDNVLIEALFDPGFVARLKKEFGGEMTLAGIFLILKPATPVVISHENQKDIDTRRVHIHSPDEQAIDKISHILEKVD